MSPIIVDHERFSKLASGFQSIVVAIAVIVGGLWTAWTFAALKTTDKARSDAETAKLNLEIQSLRRPILELAITADAFATVKNISEVFPAKVAKVLDASRLNQPKRLVHVVVTVKNNGNEDAILDTSKDTLFARRLKSAIGGLGEGFQNIGSGYKIRGIENYPKAFNVLPGNRQELHYVVEAEEDSLYQFEFSVPATRASSGQQNYDVQTGTRVIPGITTWSATTFAVIPKAVPRK